MCDKTISTFELMQMFPDNESARVYLEKRRWKGSPRCPDCGEVERITERQGNRIGFFRCRHCSVEFTVRTGTIFERSHVPLNKWIFAMYQVVTARKGVSSLQLSKEIGVTQKTAWFMLQRLREACGNDAEKLKGIIEVDETYIGGKERNKHSEKKLNAGRGPVGKIAVMGMREKGGKAIAKPLKNVNANTLQAEIRKYVEPGATIQTDEFNGYRGIGGLFYNHETINHSHGEYARGNVTTNSIESIWAVIKRGIQGVYHHTSAKHLGRYLNEFTFRLNEGNVKNHTMERLNSFAAKAFQSRITYAELTA